MPKLPPSLQAGQRVEVRGEPWLVVHVEPFDAITLVTLRGLGDANVGETHRVLCPFDRARPIAPRHNPTSAPRDKVLRSAARAIAESPRWSDCWTAGVARMDLRPWQLEPARAVIDGATRVLLADEVGLGKTIQASLIVSELSARGLAQRVLVLTPASLREQWATELSTRFGLTATVFDQASLAATIAALPRGVNPWRTAPLIVSSIDLVKRQEVRTALDDLALDVLVVDEAHHLTPGSDRAAVVADLAARTPWVVLATATPHSGHEPAYRFLCRLGDVADRGDLVTYRRAAAEVRTVRSRRVHLLGLTATPSERALLDATLEYARALWRAAPEARLVATVIARRAASSAAAARSTLERRLALIGGRLAPERQPALSWDEGDDADAEEGDDVLSRGGLAGCQDEVGWVERLITLASSAGPSSKTALIRRLLRRTRDHLIVFSEYRDVAQMVAAEIADLASVAILHGGLAVSARHAIIRAFTEGRVRVLVTTDTAGEGLNLQARCRLVVNLELPWNPLRLEQRVGRVDRLGQSRRVHAIHLFHRGSFEDTVLAQLERRRARALADLDASDAVWTAERVAGAVFDDDALDAPSRRDVEASRVASHAPGTPVATERRLRLLSSAHRDPRCAHGRPVCASTTRSGRPVNGVTLLFSADLVDGVGRLIERHLIPVELSLEWVGARPCTLTKNLLRQLANRAGASDIVRAHIAGRVEDVEGEVARLASAIVERSTDILESLDRRAHGGLYQGSLFDRRSEQVAGAHHHAARNWRDHLEGHRRAARALMSLHAARPRLVAAWPGE